MQQNNEDQRLEKAAVEAFKKLNGTACGSFYEIFKAGVQFGRKDAIENATTEELKAELKRRVDLAKAQKAEEMRNALRCRNCKHCFSSYSWGNFYQCAVRTYGKKYPRHYCVKPSTKACDKFERKMED